MSAPGSQSTSVRGVGVAISYGVIDRSRFEFDVEDIDSAAARLSAEGFVGDARADGHRAIDPDGRTVILHQRLGASPS